MFEFPVSVQKALNISAYSGVGSVPVGDSPIDESLQIVEDWVTLVEMLVENAIFDLFAMGLDFVRIE